MVKIKFQPLIADTWTVNNLIGRWNLISQIERKVKAIKTPADKPNKYLCPGSFKGHILHLNTYKLLSEERLISTEPANLLQN